MSIKLFEDDQWTDEASSLDKEIIDALKPIFDKYIKDGYSIRDMILVATQCIDTYLLREICKKRIKKT